MAGGKDEAELATEQVERDNNLMLVECAGIRDLTERLAKARRDTPTEYHAMRELIATQSVAIIQLTQMVNSIRKESLTYHRDAMKAISLLCD